MNVTAIFFLICALLVLGLISNYLTRLPKIYRLRNCQGQRWREQFPSASKNEIREFLLLFSSAFAMRESEKLKFNPDDKIMQIYRAINPSLMLPDALELETLARRLFSVYDFELETVWSSELTLGELYEKVQRKLD